MVVSSGPFDTLTGSGIHSSPNLRIGAFFYAPPSALAADPGPGELTGRSSGPMSRLIAAPTRPQ